MKESAKLSEFRMALRNGEKHLEEQAETLWKKKKIRRDDSSAETTHCGNTRWITTVQMVVLQENLQRLYWVAN